MEMKFEHNGVGKRLKSMLKVDFRRMFTMRLFYIMVGVCLIMPILILVMTTMMDGSVTVDPQTGVETVMEGFDNTWQAIGTLSSENSAMDMSLTGMCNINMLYFFVSVLVCLFVSDDFRSGYAKNLFTVRSKKSDYVISKTLVGFVGGACMLLAFFVGAAIVVCTVFTWSRGSWIAIIISSIMFFLMYSRKAFRIFGAALLVIPALPLILPDTVMNRFLSIANLSDSSISYRLYTWEGTMSAVEDNLLGGIGFGNEAFRAVYPRYAYAGIEAAEHSHSLYLQLLLALGIIGILVFAIILFLCFQNFREKALEAVQFNWQRVLLKNTLNRSILKLLQEI